MSSFKKRKHQNKPCRKNNKVRKNIVKKLSVTFSGFQRANRNFRLERNRSRSNGKQRNMSNGIQILCCIKAANPKTLLPGLLKTGVVSLCFSPECVNLFEGNALTVYRKSVIIGKSNVFCTAPVLLSVVPIFVIARANGRL